ILIQASAVVLDGFAWSLDWLDSQGWLAVQACRRPLWPEMLGYWGVLTALALAAGSEVWHGPIRRVVFPVWLLGCLAMIVVPPLAGSWHRAQDRAQVLVLDTGMSQAVLIDLPDGRRILVDGGGSWQRSFDVGKWAVVPTLTHGRSPVVDLAILTHGDADHVRGLYHVLERCRVKAFAFNGRRPKGEDGERLDELLKGAGTPVMIWAAGSRLDLGGGFWLECLHPGPGDQGFSSNDFSLVLRFGWEDQGLVLIPGDVQGPGIASLLAREARLQAEALILPHHGSRGSLDSAFLARVDPQVAVAAAGFENRYGFPAAEVVEACRKFKCPVYVTGESGAVLLQWSLDGVRRPVHCERDNGQGTNSGY
ncbi:MAG: MBL fold metallo-hydrolase, partial [Deltaproteobacteria bacterium]|nr:MBL fold metallo-hydrolase [Deltaproteobacteria bacterium]